MKKQSILIVIIVGIILLSLSATKNLLSDGYLIINNDAAFMEQPVTRKAKDTSSHGWLDYWVLYHTSVFPIELKHSWNAIKTGTIKETTQASWTEALNQLKKDSSG